MLPSAPSTAICEPPLRSYRNEPKARALAETGNPTLTSCMVEERRMKTWPPARKAASEVPGWNSPKFTFAAAAAREKLPNDLRPCAVPLYTEREEPLALLTPTSSLVYCAE